jgi:hypothetical protein
MTGCRGCLRRPVRRPTRDCLAPLFCRRCHQADDQRPTGYDGVQLRSSGKLVARAANLARRMAAGKVAHNRMVGVSTSDLTPWQRVVWALARRGWGERKIAAAAGRSQSYIYCRVIAPLRHRAGLPVRTVRYGPLRGISGPAV